ncbi:MAG: helix-turn-helix domain-containing protein [Thermoplasmata archaeon]|nr:helix-turn-helix domain-containing protein [Thermoplasmata archaeon]
MTDPDDPSYFLFQKGFSRARERIIQKLAVEILESKDPCETFRSWREEFGITQQELAREMGISSSQLSDYENGRRKNPSLSFIKRLVSALISLDEKRGSPTIKKYSLDIVDEAILDMGEYPLRIPPDRFIELIQGQLVWEENVKRVMRPIVGYTVVDSIKAILNYSAMDYLKLYGRSTERALIFTGVMYGRSPMVAIRSHPIKPAMVVYHKPGKVDPLAIKLSQLEGIPLVVTHMDLKDLVETLRNVY